MTLPVPAPVLVPVPDPLRAARLPTAALLLLPLALTACTPAPTSDADEIWRFAIEETRGSVQDAYAQRFAELVEERTDGEVDVIVYPYGTLGTSDHVTEQLHNGTLELATSSPGHLGKIIPEVQVFLLHYVLSGDGAIDAAALADPELREQLDGLYEERGLVFLTAFSEGQMVWTTREEVRTPEDFAGVRMRVMTSPLLLASYDAYGAEATPLPYSEVYSALQLQMIDGQVNPVFAIEEMSFYEVTDWMIFPHHAPFVTTVAANPDFVGGLSEERRRILQEVIGELQEEIYETQRSFNEERLDAIRERRPEVHVIHLSEEEQRAFRERAEQVQAEFVEETGPEAARLLEVLREAVERAAQAGGAGGE